MATPASQPPQVPPRRHPILRRAAIVVLVLIALVGLSVLITWRAVRPKSPIYTVETASLQNFTLSQKRLDATFDFVIRSYNPNSVVSIYYDFMEASVASKQQTLAYREMPPFFQPHRHETRLDARLSTRNVTLFDRVSKNLALGIKSGKIRLHIWITAKIRFRVGVWKSRDRTLRVSCSPVDVLVSKTKSFDPTNCSVEL